TEHPVGPRLGTKEDHAATRRANGSQRLIAVAEENVDARFAPPLELQRRDERRQFSSIRFAQEEVVVVELNRIDLVFLLKEREDSRGPFRSLIFLAPAGHRHDTAELASERAPEARLMHHRTLSEERSRDVTLRIAEAMIGHPGIVTRRSDRTVGSVNVKA